MRMFVTMHNFEVGTWYNVHASKLTEVESPRRSSLQPTPIQDPFVATAIYACTYYV